MGFVAGALAGFGVLAVVAFQGVSAEAKVAESPPSLVVSTIHVVATGGTLRLVSLVLVLAGGSRPLVTFLVVGTTATVAYNLLLLLEGVVVRKIA